MSIASFLALHLGLVVLLLSPCCSGAAPSTSRWRPHHSHGRRLDRALRRLLLHGELEAAELEEAAAMACLVAHREVGEREGGGVGAGGGCRRRRRSPERGVPPGGLERPHQLAHPRRRCQWRIALSRPRGGGNMRAAAAARSASEPFSSAAPLPKQDSKTMVRPAYATDIDASSSSNC
nr:unnamed protein product [Digitaria exilis]